MAGMEGTGGKRLIVVGDRVLIEPEEGEAQVAALLARNDQVRIDPLRADEPFGDTEWAKASGVLRTFPFQLALDTPEWSGMDGFFAARLVHAGQGRNP